MGSAAMGKELDRKNLRTALGVGLIVLVSLAVFIYKVWPFA